MEKSKKKNSKIVKLMIIVMLFLMCIVPTALCVYVMIRMDNMEKQLNVLIEKEEHRSETEKIVEASLYNGALMAADEVAAKVDQDAATYIEKDSSDIEILSMQGNTADDVKDDSKKKSKKVYLTFDDGPSDHTDEILEVLAEENVKATFFVCGADVAYYDEYRKIVAGGHTLGIHSMTHNYDTVYADLDSFKQDVSSLHDLLYNVTGVDVKYYRFPGGSSNKVADVDVQDCIRYLTDAGYTYYDWNALNEDATGTYYSAEELNKKVLKYVHGNKGDSIVLMHDLNGLKNTREALKPLIETLKQEGYEILPISEKTTPVQHRKLKEQ